jgi:hypothetical protein
MDEEPLRASAAEVIAAAVSVTSADRARLAAALHSWCWPGGAADRTEPVGRAWVRRTGPRRVDALDLRCTCREGRCELCN